MMTGSICPARFITKEQINPYLGIMQWDWEKRQLCLGKSVEQVQETQQIKPESGDSFEKSECLQRQAAYQDEALLSTDEFCRTHFLITSDTSKAQKEQLFC